METFSCRAFPSKHVVYTGIWRRRSKLIISTNPYWHIYSQNKGFTIHTIFEIPLFHTFIKLKWLQKKSAKKARIPKINISHFKASKMSSLSMSIQDFHLLVDPQDSDFETKVQYKLFFSACVDQNMLYFAVIVFSYLFCVSTHNSK